MIYNIELIDNHVVFVENDLAILKIEEMIYDIPYSIGNDIVDVAEKVYTYGCPLKWILGSELKYTSGEINGKTGFDGDLRFLQHTAPIQPGNSGGPLFDKNGDVVGINTLGWSTLQNVFASVKVRFLTSHMYDLGISIPNENNLKFLDKTDQYKEIKDYVYRIIIK